MVVSVLQIREVEVAIRTSHFICVGARSSSSLSDSVVKSFILFKKSRENPLSAWMLCFLQQCFEEKMAAAVLC